MEGEQGRTGEEEKRIYGAGGIILYGQGAEGCTLRAEMSKGLPQGFNIDPLPLPTVTQNIFYKYRPPQGKTAGQRHITHQ